jgi:hypothetical protein
LDSHWSGGETYGKGDECPLLAESGAFRGKWDGHVLLVDDARLFLSPPPEPHKIQNWPTIDRVLTAIGGRYSVIFEDVIVSVPEEAKEALSTYCQEKNTEDWKRHIARSKPGFWKRLLGRLRR